MSFIRDYALYSSGVESPSHYHTWCALSVLGTWLSKKVWTDMGYFKVYPNMYILLVGDPGIKKSTAMNIAKKLVLEVGERQVSPASITKEALMQYLGAEKSPCKFSFDIESNMIDPLTGQGTITTETRQIAHISIFANELVNLLNAGGNPVGMIDLLTDIWDQDPYVNVTKNKGSDLIKGPFVHLLGCLTPETMEALLFQKFISGGFSRRCIYTYADQNERPVPLPSITQEQGEAWLRCKQRGKVLLDWCGEYQWSPEFKNDLWVPWYRENFQRCQSEEKSFLKRFLQSLPEYLLKVMMLVTASESDTRLLTPQAFFAAKAILEPVQETLPRIFEFAGRNELNPIAGGLLRMLQAKNEVMKMKTIYSMYSKDASIQEIDTVVESLVKQEQVLTAVVKISDTQVRIIGTTAVVNRFIEQMKQPKQN